MARDYRKLVVFQLADELVLEVYRATAGFPAEEKFALQSQIRRAAISVPANIVEGSSRATTKDYVHFLVMALGSATEMSYLLSVSTRLNFMKKAVYETMQPTCDHLLRALQKLIDSLSK